MQNASTLARPQATLSSELSFLSSLLPGGLFRPCISVDKLWATAQVRAAISRQIFCKSRTIVPSYPKAPRMPVAHSMRPTQHASA